MRTQRRKPGPPLRPTFDGKFLRSRRLALGVTQREIGDACGVTGSCVNRWERGISRPNPKVRSALAALLHTTRARMERGR